MKNGNGMVKDGRADSMSITLIALEIDIKTQCWGGVISSKFLSQGGGLARMTQWS